jgi:RNA polymerase sigma-70 factor (ECF subfamily)
MDLEMALDPPLPRPPVAAAAPTPPAALADGELVARARRGDETARDELARRCRRPAYLLALQLLRDPDDARDVAQDALLRFFSRLDRFTPGRAVQPWLCAIVRNRACDLVRSRRRHPEESLDARDEPGTGRRDHEVVDTAPGPEASAERRELQARIWRALAALGEREREILVLRDYQDLSYEEIAGVLAVPMGTVMSRLHRARRALAARLAEGGGP